jgi:HK97 family phage prohead protease
MEKFKIGDFVRSNNADAPTFGRVVDIAADAEKNAPTAVLRVYEYNAETETYVEIKNAPNETRSVDELESFDAPVMERRLTTRAADIDGMKIRGYAAVFNAPSEDLGGFIEYIAPGAFDNVMSDDVRAFFNHDWNYLLGRVSSGTLRLWVDEVGLGYEIDLPNTTYANDLVELMRRGDINQSSFAFMIESDKWVIEGEKWTRTITKVSRLIDVAPVVIPAYPTATSQLVSRALNVDEVVDVPQTEPIGLENENVNEVERPNLRSLILRIINLNS